MRLSYHIPYLLTKVTFATNCQTNLTGIKNFHQEKNFTAFTDHSSILLLRVIHKKLTLTSNIRHSSSLGRFQFYRDRLRVNKRHGGAWNKSSDAFFGSKFGVAVGFYFLYKSPSRLLQEPQRSICKVNSAPRSFQRCRYG